MFFGSKSLHILDRSFSHTRTWHLWLQKRRRRADNNHPPQCTWTKSSSRTAYTLISVLTGKLLGESHGGGSRPLPPTCFVEMKNGHPVHMWTRIFEGTEGKTKEEAQHVHVSTISIPLYGLNLSPFEYMQIKEYWKMHANQVRSTIVADLWATVLASAVWCVGIGTNDVTAFEELCRSC